MSQVVVTIKVMPENPEVNLDDLEKKVLEKIGKFAGEGETKVSKEPIGFGLSSLNVIFVMDEEKGDTKPLEDDISGMEEVASAEIIDVRKAL